MHYKCFVPLAPARVSLLPLLLLVAACAVPNQSQSQGKLKQPIVDESNPIELDARALDLTVVAFDAFKAQNKNWRCFNVSIYNQGENWRVDFTPSDDVQEADETLLVGVSKCGNGVSYIVSHTGKIVRVIHAR